MHRRVAAAAALNRELRRIRKLVERCEGDDELIDLYGDLIAHMDAEYDADELGQDPEDD